MYRTRCRIVFLIKIHRRSAALIFAPTVNRPENQIRLVNRPSLAVDLMVEERAEV